MSRPVVWASCLVLVLGAGGAMPVLAADYYLKIQGIEGESKDKGHEKWIELTSIAWLTPDGAPSSSATPSGPGRIKVKFPSLPNTTPLLQRALSTNYVYGEVLLDVLESPTSSSSRTAGYMRFTLERVFISGYTPGSGARSMEELALNFERIKLGPAPVSLSAPPARAPQ